MRINPKAIKQRYMDKIEDSLTSEGVVFYDPHDETLNISEEYLTLPSEITDVPSRELGEYLNAFTQQKMYYRTLLGRLELQVEDARRVYYEISAELYHEMSKTKVSETAKERIINDDETVRPFYLNYRDEKNRLNLLNYAISNIEDAQFLVSREITRRTGDFNEETRNHNVSRK
jgi:hypothetical protein